MHEEPTFPFGRSQYVQSAYPVGIHSGAESEKDFQAERIHDENLWVVTRILKVKGKFYRKL